MARFWCVCVCVHGTFLVCVNCTFLVCVNGTFLASADGTFLVCVDGTFLVCANGTLLPACSQLRVPSCVLPSPLVQVAGRSDPLMSVCPRRNINAPREFPSFNGTWVAFQMKQQYNQTLAVRRGVAINYNISKGTKVNCICSPGGAQSH